MQTSTSHFIGPHGSNCRNNITVNRTIAEEEGYPKISVQYGWTICNGNVDKNIKLIPSKSQFKLKSNESIFDKNSPIKPGEFKFANKEMNMNKLLF